MNVSGSQPPNRSASATPLQLSQFPVDKVSPHVDGCDVLLTQQRASYAPPAVAPSQWSMYTATGTGRSVPAESPMHSQGPSHFAGRSDFDRSIHGGSRAEASPSLSRHDSRGSMLAAKGMYVKDDIAVMFLCFQYFQYFYTFYTPMLLCFQYF